MRVIGIVLGIMVIMSGLLMWAPYSKGDLENLADGPIVVDEHWIDVFQQADKSTLDIDEYLFINNTGDEPYSGDFYIWVDDGSDIIAKCCGNAPNMACRFQTGGAMACFNFAQTEDNVFKGEPFFSNDIVSYYNQEGQLKIHAQSRENISIKKTLDLNVIVGGHSVLRAPGNNSDNGPLSITSDRNVIGVDVQLKEDMPNNMTVLEKLQIFNNATDIVILDFAIEGIPLGWSAEILHNSEPKTDINLSPFEEANLILSLTVPSYIAPIKVSYLTKIDKEGDEKIKGTFVKQYLYNSKTVEYFIFALSDRGVTLSNDLRMVHPTSDGEPELNQENNRYWYVAQSFNILADSKSTITLEWENQEDVFSILAWILIVIIIALLIGVPLIRRRSNLAKTSNTEDNDSSLALATGSGINKTSDSKEIKDEKQEIPPQTMKKSEISSKTRVSSLTYALNKLKEDHENGFITNEMYKELDNKYTDKLHLAEEELKKEKELNSKKQRITLAIERLTQDHTEGRLDDETYNRLLEDYKKVQNEMPDLDA
jgi:hypothetical protein